MLAVDGVELRILGAFAMRAVQRMMWMQSQRPPRA
jgi:hypothetical protein